MALIIGLVGTIATLFSIAATNCAATAPCVSNSADVTGKTWRLDFSDEFNGTSLDSTKWASLRGGAAPGGFGYQSYVGYPYNNNENAFYKSANTSVGNGALTFTLKQESSTGFPYTTGMVQSGPKYSVGPTAYIEARIKVPSCTGCWPTFWMLPAPTESTWPPEIDIFEFFESSSIVAYPKMPYFNYHWPPGDNSINSRPYGNTGTDYTQDYHVYGAYWDSGKIVPYIDGVAYQSLSATSNVTSNKMYLIMALQFMKTHTLTSTQQMSVDWVRVWKPTTSSSTPPPDSTPSTPPSTPSTTPSAPSVPDSPTLPDPEPSYTGTEQSNNVIDIDDNSQTPSPVGGVVSLPPSNPGATQKIVEVDGITVAPNGDIDTTRLTNGEHTITVETTDENGQTTKKAVKIVVNNDLSLTENIRNHILAFTRNKIFFGVISFAGLPLLAFGGFIAVRYLRLRGILTS